MKLIQSINQYFLLCNAGIKHEMAKRIMYSIIPSLATTTEMYFTSGIVDYKALRAATEGVDELIKYGIRAISNELEHFVITKQFKEPKNKNLYNETQLYKETNILKFLENAIKIFNINWTGERGGTNYSMDMFGGEPWAEISKSLFKIAKLNIEAKKIKKQQNMEQEMNILQQLVVELNIFDGLSHNTDSILKNILNEEFKEKETGDYIFNDKALRQSNEFKDLKYLMDLKEIMDPVDVYKEIEKTLTESGDIHRFKDWTTKIRQHPKYREKSDIGYELFLIKYRKEFLYYIKQINMAIDYIDDVINLIKDTDEIQSNEKAINLAIQKASVIFYPTIFRYRKDIVDEVIPRTLNPNKIYDLLKKMDLLAYDEMKNKDSIINQIFRSHSLSPFEFKAKPNLLIDGLINDLEKLKRHLQKVSNYLQSV